MTSEDWKTVLLAFIGVLMTAVTTGGSILGTYLLIRLKQVKTLVNGRMDEMRKQERAAGYAEGHAAGLAIVSQAVANSPQIPLSAAAVAQAVANTAQPQPNPSNVGPPS